jgi:murein DD-endopeptidase MepM/ murein hydrolase activator NlpD
MTDPHQNGRNNSNNPKRFWRRSTWFVGVALISFFLVGASHHFPKAPTQTAHKFQITKLELPPLEIKPAQFPEVAPQPELEKEVFRLIKGDVARNQSLSHLMGDHGIPLETVLELVKQSRPTYNLNRLRPGQPYSIKLTSDDQLVSFSYQADEDRELFIERKGDEFVSRLVAPDYEIKLEVLEGVIQDNLITTVLDAGGSYQVATDLEEIFAWQINFFKDPRVGDSFKVLVEKKFLDKEFSGFGKIRAATFQNRGETLAAIYFQPEDGHGGYYAPDGRPLKKQFLKSPLKYTRITSGFSQNRFHPIYKKHMAHRAVDYAAPRGTPIYAVSDGEVISVSRNSRSGNHLKLRHRNGYESSYSHLSRYAANLSRGKKIQQGQVIGYVGATGAATGPHLCFHLRKNGRSINPLTFQSPGGPDLEEKSRKAFRLIAQQEMQALNHPESLNTQIG